MGSAIPQGRLAEIVRDARSRTGVPAVAAGLSAEGSLELVDADTPFRIASISKWFTASLASAAGVLDAETRRLLSHTADLRPEVAEPLPEVCRGLWSYANSGYWAVGERVAAVTDTSFAEAMRDRILEPLGLRATSFHEPDGAACGHVQEGVNGQRPVQSSPYPASRFPSGGLWSTVEDLLRFAEDQFDDPYGVQEPQADALGAEYCLGCWRRELDGGRIAFDHEGSVASFQSLLLIVPEERFALAVLTNSWRGSGAIRRVIRDLGLNPASNSASLRSTGLIEPGKYALDSVSAEVRDGWITEQETDPIMGAAAHRKYRISFDAALMSHRVDFPRPGVARIGWNALERVGA
ncbi:MAG: D-alanyl-D-alanine carboxypeptidase [Gaiellaceae bacterium]|jgi:CubicO group peptidase (beta-lactamase class C family)|nr:D-alanyl-D-alanine carboxypeptidase [Gaiellaceae bacterium]